MQIGKLRRKARKCAVQILYAVEFGDCSVDDILSAKSVIPDCDEIDDYAVVLVKNIPQHVKQIDKMIEEVSLNWNINRIATVDKILLRLAIYEMKYMDDVPVSVSINEAVELAKQFGGDEESHRFINGILGKVALNLEEKDD